MRESITEGVRESINESGKRNKEKCYIFIQLDLGCLMSDAVLMSFFICVGELSASFSSSLLSSLFISSRLISSLVSSLHLVSSHRISSLSSLISSSPLFFSPLLISFIHTYIDLIDCIPTPF